MVEHRHEQQLTKTIDISLRIQNMGILIAHSVSLPIKHTIANNIKIYKLKHYSKKFRHSIMLKANSMKSKAMIRLTYACICEPIII